SVSWTTSYATWPTGSGTSRTSGAAVYRISIPARATPATSTSTRECQLGRASARACGGAARAASTLRSSVNVRRLSAARTYQGASRPVTTVARVVSSTGVRCAKTSWRSRIRYIRCSRYARDSAAARTAPAQGQRTRRRRTVRPRKQAPTTIAVSSMRIRCGCPRTSSTGRYTRAAPVARYQSRSAAYWPRVYAANASAGTTICDLGVVSVLSSQTALTSAKTRPGRRRRHSSRQAPT
ncbi:hypothetical protein TR74_15015, partial [Carbonactinospora thermoautotrophica]